MLDEGLTALIDSLSIDPEALAAINPVALSAVIKPTLGLSMIEQPIRLTGVIDATVNYLTGANVGGGGGGGGEDPVQRSQVAQDLSTIARVLKDATAPVSGNLDPSLGPTPRINIPTPNLDIDNDPEPDATQPQGFGEALRNANQFRQGGPGGGHAGQAGTLRVTLPTETLSRLAQQSTLLKQFLSVNDHLSTIRTTLANDTDFATEATLSSINTALDDINLATQTLAQAPLVDQLVKAGSYFLMTRLTPQMRHSHNHPSKPCCLRKV